MTIPETLQLAIHNHRAGRLSEAEMLYRQVLSQMPNHSDALHLLGVIANQAGQTDTAVELITKAIAINPSAAEYHNNLGNALRNKGLLDEAIAALRQAIRLKPDLAEAHANLGNVLTDKGLLADAENSYSMALKLKPDFARAHNHLSHVLLLQGKFEQGWSEHEWRWRCEDFPSPNRDYARPQWEGSPLDGRTILLHAEQGFGDAIQFARYIPMVARVGGKIVLECQPELFRLFSCLEGVQDMIGIGQPLPPFDLHCPLLSLPLHFRTRLESIPAQVPYLAPSEDLKKHWAKKLPPRNARLRVGLVWGGNPAFKLDRTRSLTFPQMAPVTALDGITFYSLQKRTASQNISSAQEMRLVDLTSDMKDFADTAAIISQLDLVISTDTAVAHLAGALAARTWLLLQFIPDWRWLLDRPDTPWYPTTRLFRQKNPGAWPEVIERIAESLKLLR